MALTIGDHTFNQRLILGTARYPSLHCMKEAIIASKTNLITVSIRRQTAHQSTADQHKKSFWQYLKQLPCHLLPNTAGCKSADEAIQTAHIARDLFDTNWIKLEVIGDDYTLTPDPIALLEATKHLIAEGFTVLPYTTDDLVICQRLVDLGCHIVMPWAAPIGSGQGIRNPNALRTLRQRLPNTTLIIDAGIGTPAHACEVMGMGFDAVLLNSAVALAHDPVQMSKAFQQAVEAGRLAYHAGLMKQQDFASPSTPLFDKPLWEPMTCQKTENA